MITIVLPVRLCQRVQTIGFAQLQGTIAEIGKGIGIALAIELDAIALVGSSEQLFCGAEPFGDRLAFDVISLALRLKRIIGLEIRQACGGRKGCIRGTRSQKAEEQN
jgi:hypothetical protein